MRARALVLLLLFFFGAAPARALDVEGSLRLLNRVNYQKDMVQNLVVFDEAARRFRVEEYLLPSADHAFSTHVVGGFLDAYLGSGWSFTGAVDSGVLRAGEQNIANVQVFTVEVGRQTRRILVPVITTRTQVELSANGIPFPEEAERSLFLRESYFTYSAGRWARLVAGKRRVILADGFLYDQFTFGAGLHLDASRRAAPSPWRFDLDVLIADGSFDSGGKRSPIVHLGAHYVPGPFQFFGFTLVYFHDGNDLLSEVFRTSITEAGIDRALQSGRTGLAGLQVPLESGGDLLWFGLSGRRFFGDHRVRAALFGQYGRVQASTVIPSLLGGAPAVRAIESTATGLLADVHYQYDVTQDLVAGGFFTFATGDDGLAGAFARDRPSPTLGAFFSIFPFLTRSNLFFNGGLNAEFTLRRASTIGVNARGLLMAGAFTRWEHEDLTLEAKAVALGAHRPSIHGGRYYGTEVDLGLRVPLARQLHLVAEADALFTGGFFARERTVLQLIFGFDAGFP